MKEQTQTQSRKMRKIYNVFMQQTSPQNPFGPNYLKLPITTKLSYKYNIMKDYFLPNTKDQQRLQNQQLRFVGILLTGLTGGYFIGFLAKKLFFRSEKFINYQSLFYLITMTSTFTYSYFIAHQRYTREICEYFLQNYKQEAISNGFKDYLISQ